MLPLLVIFTKNQNLIPKFKELHPDYNKASSKFSDQYNTIIIESMGGRGDNDVEKENKIIGAIKAQKKIDYKSLLPQVSKLGVQYFIVEQEAYTGTNELDAAKADAAYVSTLNW